MLGDTSAEMKPETRGAAERTQSSVLSPQSSLGLSPRRSLTALNLPRPVEIEADGAGVPCAVTLGGRRAVVEAVLDSWRIDDEWWREEISRRYHHLALTDGRTFTVFLDLLTGAWYTQRYSVGLQTTVLAAVEPVQTALAS
jgi:hypothetical protein